jgi:hypothetical protein
MRSLSLLLVALLFGLAGTSAREADALVYTFSIVARDPTTGGTSAPEAVAAAGHLVGEQFSGQANMMANATVWPAMRAGSSPPRSSWCVASCASSARTGTPTAAMS